MSISPYCPNIFQGKKVKTPRKQGLDFQVALLNCSSALWRAMPFERWFEVGDRLFKLFCSSMQEICKMRQGSLRSRYLVQRDNHSGCCRKEFWQEDLSKKVTKKLELGGLFVLFFSSGAGEREDASDQVSGGVGILKREGERGWLC